MPFAQRPPPVEQALPHEPQFRALLRTSTHWPLHTFCPAAHMSPAPPLPWPPLPFAPPLPGGPV